MSLRFLKVSSYYRDFLYQYYSLYPDIPSLSYAEQYTHLMNQYFALSDNYGYLLAGKGLTTMEVVANALPMQKKWASENGIPEDLSIKDTLEQQIAWFKPEIVYFQDSNSFNGEYINYLRTKYSFIRLCIGSLCSPFSSAQIENFKVFDYFVVCSPFFYLQLKNLGIKSVIIPHAFDKRILKGINENNHYPESALTFIGSIFPGEGFHSLRLKILESLVKEDIPFKFYGNLMDKSMVNLVKRKLSFISSHVLDSIGLKRITDKIPSIQKGRAHLSMPTNLNISQKIYEIAEPPVFGIEMFKALSKASIGFNIHADCAGDYTANMRIYETTGVGSCLLTDMKSDLSNYFEVDSEVVAYSSKEECIEKIKWLVNHPNECKAIAIKGQERALKDHNYESRIDIFYDYLLKQL